VTNLNPQAKQMADESMVRNLAAQTLAIWPQEVELIRRYALPDEISILDARSRHARLAPRLTFEHQSIFGLDAADRAFDLTVCRHVIHSIPHPDRVLVELARVTRPGGRLHLIPEDYGMLHFQRGALDPRDFWHEVPARFGEATGTDLFIGRNTFGILAGHGCTDITIDYVVVDTLRVPRETFAAILEAWRDGYAESVAALTRFTRDETIAYFDHMIANIRDPNGYAVWMVPVVSARVR
jgi:ubiquinone/menaquinone biosynthesis C-methylase UbiE